MSNSSQIERIYAREIARWERRLFYSDGSYKVTLPKALVDAFVLRRKGGKAIFSTVFDERSGKVLMVMEIVPEG
jgi:hypothetical protein